jgi:hypothetical protein
VHNLTFSIKILFKKRTKKADYFEVEFLISFIIFFKSYTFFFISTIL